MFFGGASRHIRRLGRFNRLSALAQASLVLCEPNGVLAFKSQVAAIETTLAKLGHLSTGYISPFKNKRHAMNTSLNCRPPGILAAISVVLASIAMPVVADDLMFKLSGDMEVPSVNTAATGEGAITIKPDMSVTGKVMTRGLDGTMAHIHLGKAGTNGPVVITLSKSGNNGWIVPEGSKLGEAEYKAYKAGELYVNVHSADHKPGEIRGQLLPPAAPTSSY